MKSALILFVLAVFFAALVSADLRGGAPSEFSTRTPGTLSYAPQSKQQANGGDAYGTSYYSTIDEIVYSTLEQAKPEEDFYVDNRPYEKYTRLPQRLPHQYLASLPSLREFWMQPLTSWDGLFYDEFRQHGDDDDNNSASTAILSMIVVFITLFAL